MDLHLSEREESVVLAALDFFQRAKRKTVSDQLPFEKVSEYDLLSPQHAAMSALTVMTKMTKKPVEYFVNPNPSQLPQIPPPNEKDHPA
jgi:hypothetical protein